MRRILKATTAIVTSISLVLPQIAVAQDNGATPAQILQQKRAEKQQEQKQQKKKPAEARQEPKREQQRKEQRGAAPEKKAQTQQPKRQPKAEKPAEQKKQREAQPERQPQQKRQQAKEDQPKKRAQPEQRQEQPKRKAQQAEQQPKRQVQPERRDVQGQPDLRERQAQPEGTRRDQPQRRPNDAPKPNVRAADEQRNPQAPRNGDAPARRQGQGAGQRDTPPRNADELRRAMDNQREGLREGQGNGQPERRSNDDATQRAGNQRQQNGDQQRPANQQARANQRQEARREAELRQKRQEERQAAERRQQSADAKEVRRRMTERKGEDLPAPEARVRPNDLARRAAQGGVTPAAVALAANGDRQRGEVVDRKITDRNSRRADQDFDTRIEDGARERVRPAERQRNAEIQRRERELRQERLRLQEARRDNDDDRDWRALQIRERELREEEARLDRRDRELDRWDDWDDDRDNNDDDDDNGKDIAKLLLAGAAGFAVGRMMSGNRQVALNTGDRAVLTLPDGSQQIVRDDNALLYQPGSDVQTETFQDGSTRTTVLRADGSRVVTIRDADTNILRRYLIRSNGTQTQLINDTQVRPVEVSSLPAPQPVEYRNSAWNENELRQALLQESDIDRRFTLGQVRDIPEVRSLVAPVNVPEITFDSGSAALNSDQAEQLATLGKVISDSVAENPNEIYMIEGYTDAVGSNATNLALSDRRAESVALALTEYYQVPPENMVVQGYGEQFMLIPSDADERDNRRVAVRRITDLLEQSDS